MKKYPQEYPPHYLNKKRADHDDNSNAKKRYDYEDKYDRYEKYDKYGNPSNYGMNYQNSYHSGNSNKYRGKDYHYSNNKYHGSNYSNNKSPRRDYKKPYQKYNADSEPVRNLSHCDIPLPIKKKEDKGWRL